MKQWSAAVLTVGIMLVASGCGAQAQEPQEHKDTLPEHTESIQGTVLDITKETLILRTSSGQEYVLNLDGNEIQQEDKILIGSYVAVDYTGQLIGTGKNVDVISVKASKTETVEAIYKDCVVQGRIVSLSSEKMKIKTKQENEYEFVISQAVHETEKKLKKGMWVRLFFDGKQDSIQQAKVKIIQDAAHMRGTMVISGTIQSITEDEIFFTAANKTLYGLDVSLLPDSVLNDLEKGQKKTLYYHQTLKTDSQGNLVLQVLEMESEPQEEKTMYAVVEAYDEKQKKLTVRSYHGTQITFWLDKTIELEKLNPNDEVMVQYTGWIDSNHAKNAKVISIKRKEKAEKAKNILLGKVKQLDEKGLLVHTLEGRDILFTNKDSANSISPALTVGDNVCVYYHGWLEEATPKIQENASVIHVSKMLM